MNPVQQAATLSCVPRIGAGFRLQWEPAQNAHVLLYPEGLVKLNGSAGEILTRCDGARSVAELVALLEAAFSAQGLAPDVLAFLDMARAQGWISLARA
ncbi:pyrroloquinoline quinone biosynthesis peptide chaperone PqqD [Aquabacterium sp. OR-4]|uniref:pyrroloquinoline quinone biosynthesis peptide chaperone PqqD n=1 Tax=Aquabacterium sp. OR-4 TaxID=2978127 RepID=UPI0021B281B1|nr:pyrroloquinoline quinone biosynthesis peptide chaperone PqqD [Aquabacterium sp. OR-4]MDT7835284.1 pyrroloquinoline quinone biosynthesis peptide chaperone PqqD [Aquabacterium sp. OR-4]